MNEQREEPGPLDPVVRRRLWSDTERFRVYCRVDDDYKTIDMNGRDDLTCPVCGTNTLAYRRTAICTMTAWCSHCQCGIKQGNGAA